MKINFKIALLLLMLITGVCTMQGQGKKRQWTKEMLDYKHEFIVKETGMTQAQRDKFMPIYEAMEKEIYNVNHSARQQARKVGAANNVSDDEYGKAAKAMAVVKSKEGEIETRYFVQYSKILSKKQLFLLKQAEIKFYRKMTEKKKK